MRRHLHRLLLAVLVLAAPFAGAQPAHAVPAHCSGQDLRQSGQFPPSTAPPPMNWALEATVVCAGTFTGVATLYAAGTHNGVAFFGNVSIPAFGCNGNVNGNVVSHVFVGLMLTTCGAGNIQIVWNSVSTHVEATFS